MDEIPVRADGNSGVNLGYSIVFGGGYRFGVMCPRKWCYIYTIYITLKLVSRSVYSKLVYNI